MCDYSHCNVWKRFDKNKHIQIEYDYIIEKNSLIYPNLSYLLLNDKNVWNKSDDGMDLHLDYWLTTDTKGNKIFVNNKNSIPFSVGKRDCLGKLLAIKEMQAFFGNLLLQYQISKSHVEDDYKIHYRFGRFTSFVDPEMSVKVRKRL